METVLLYSAIIFGFSIVGFYYETITKKIKKMPINTIVTGPYHPIYGIGVAYAFLICSIDFNVWLQFLAIATGLILFEYLGVLFFNKLLKLELWDYSNKFLNLQGQICLSVSIVWIAFSALFSFLLFGLLTQWLVPTVNVYILVACLCIIFIHDLIKTSLKKAGKI